MVLSERVGGVRGDDMADPTKRAAGANPKSGGNNEPKYARQNAAVVELAHTGNQKAQKTCSKWIAHRLLPPCSWTPYDSDGGFVREKCGRVVSEVYCVAREILRRTYPLLP